MKKACVLGCGISGKGALHLLEKIGYQAVGIDKKPFLHNSFPTFLEDQIDLNDFSLMVVSPGISQKHFLIQEALSKGIEVVGEIELGLRYLNNYCIAITGTNGKTTTALLVTHILTSNNVPAICLGNSGISLCEEVLQLKKEQIVVLELSSYQLEWIVSKKIDDGIILNIEEDHLDRYSDFNQYALAKLKLLSLVKKNCWLQRDLLNNYDLASKKSVLNKLSFFDSQQIVATLNKLGYTNTEGLEYESYFAAWQLTKNFVSKDGFCKSVCSFKKPEHRLEKFVKINGVVVYNDSKSTNPASVIYALRKIPNKVVLMLGGEDKGLSYKKILEEKEKIATLICFGKANKKIANELFSLKPILVSNVEEAASIALSKAKKDEAILFSPGCSSFDAFKNYEERGFFFKKIMRLLKERAL